MTGGEAARGQGGAARGTAEEAAGGKGGGYQRILKYQNI